MGANVFSSESMDDLGKRQKFGSQAALLVKTVNEIVDQEQPKSGEGSESAEKDPEDPSKRQIAV
ncbi:hypothetical protein, partial [Streptomyces turgidiscabies]|uniref:hypothetical protein n=1 Tax=Streptomyces turgidiscabies TaxID=85558 RepID=UPI0038F694CE